jgi:pectin lyase
MPSFAALGAALVAAASVVSAQSVSGKPEGFGSKATGGAGGKTVTPTTTEELENYLTSSEALTVVLAQTFDFRGTEGTASEKGCAPYGTGSACQVAINKDDWYEAEECNKMMIKTLC